MRNPIQLKPKGRRQISEQVVQSLAITSQMALLYPPGIDEWMRRELGCCQVRPGQRSNGSR